MSLVRKLNEWVERERAEAVTTAPVWHFERSATGAYVETRVR